MKTVKVVAAVIKALNQEGESIIFATQRGYGEFKDGWEFPGGKIEEGETPQEALKREIMEELDTEITVGKLIDTIEYEYPTFHLSMDCFWCEVVKGELVLKEAEDIAITKIARRADYRPVSADSNMEDLMEKAMDQNFVPVIDDQENFIGIITRKDIIGYCYEKIKKIAN